MEKEHFILISESCAKIFLGGFMIMVFILFILALVVGNEGNPQQVASEKLRSKEKQLQQKEERLKQIEQQLKTAR